MTRSPWLRVYDMQLLALFRLGFPTAPGLPSLNLAAYRNSQAHSTKGTLQSLRSVTSCQFMVSGSISLPLQGFFSPFPHGTCSLSVATEYLALDRGRPGFRQGSTCPAVLRHRIMESDSFRVRGFHTLRRAFPDPSTMNRFSLKLHGSSPCGPTTPLKVVWAPPLSLAATHGISGGSLPFLISSPMLLRWFTSHGVAPPAYFIQLSRYRNRSLWVTPFGHPRINGYLLLPVAFHSLSRPSSPRSS